MDCTSCVHCIRPFVCMIKQNWRCWTNCSLNEVCIWPCGNFDIKYQRSFVPPMIDMVHISIKLHHLESTICKNASNRPSNVAARAQHLFIRARDLCIMVPDLCIRAKDLCIRADDLCKQATYVSNRPPRVFPGPEIFPPFLHMFPLGCQMFSPGPHVGGR